ncbi:MAG: phosphate propanoyltransferase [Faecalibacterium sp.]
MEAKDIQYITKLVVEALEQQQGCVSDKIPVGISARHIHLTQKDVDVLFGAGYQLTKKKDLMGGQYAANETVLVISPRMKIMENVRVLGPVRKASQLEISATDAMKLGVKAPLRDSGDTAASAGVTLVGPSGTVTLAEGCIVAARHVHMSPADATRLNVRDGQMISVRFAGNRPTVFEDVKVRVDASFTLEMHIDTDEANAVGLKPGGYAELVR